VVDDNLTNRIVLGKMLAHWEMRFSLTSDAQSAMVELKHSQDLADLFQLILVDLCMPDVGGFDLCEQMQTLRTSSVTTVMMLSSPGQSENIARCQQLGVAAYLIKPVSQAELGSTIVSILSGRKEQSNPQKPVVGDSSRASVDGLRILLAEDNRVNQLLATKLLQKQGHSVVVANNGQEVLASVRNQGFDLILMDLNMPVMGGFEATALIREREKMIGGHVPIVALTANAMKGDREKCIAAGMDDYLSKPINIKELQLAIATTSLVLSSNDHPV
jgi:two-component system sensor histidine kinase/response regulator